jgi:hypothetical protein
MGMARGEKATFLSRRVESPPPVGMTPFEEVSKKRLKPIGRSTVPPTMRNMLSGTSKIFSIAVPNTRKKKKQIREEYLPKLAPVKFRVPYRTTEYRKSNQLGRDDQAI